MIKLYEFITFVLNRLSQHKPMNQQALYDMKKNYIQLFKLQH
jgi:hypothetical protein